jgi:hypothetical protein
MENSRYRQKSDKNLVGMINRTNGSNVSAVPVNTTALMNDTGIGILTEKKVTN